MRVAVVGAGAMGCLYGGHLAEAGVDVSLMDVWREHVDAINAKGLHMTGVSGDRVVHVPATIDPETVGEIDLMLLFVKSYDTAQAMRDSGPLIGGDTCVLTLQNGLGNLEAITEVVGAGRVLGGTTSHGSTLVGPGEIRHAGVGPTVIGTLDGGSRSMAETAADMFNGAGLQTRVSGDVRGDIWGKVLVNLGINALTALTGLRNGQLLEIPELRLLMRLAVEEGMMVAEADGVDLSIIDHVAHVYEVAEATGANRSSMLQDVDRGRRTEIDALNGAVVGLGEKLGVETPVNRALTSLVKGLEHGASL
ncbi:2-dehydropantoate 2-reductase [Candidatus Bathyarchaeota archaeon]|nr:2-dehydropantoate 2-reductase [Candidatus Bathyarchaeota archaeon]